MNKLRTVLTEAIQFVPTLALAAGYVIAGEIDFSVAGTRFLIAALLVVPIFGWLAFKGTRQNPILVGSNLWLIVGAIGFNLHIDSLQNLLIDAAGGGLFVGSLLAGVVYTVARPEGFVGVEGPRKMLFSGILVALTAASMVWALGRPEDIRLGAALPFIGLNVVRRMMGRVSQRSIEVQEGG